MGTIQDAARLLIVHSSDAARELARRAPSSPIYQQLYNRFAGEVLSDQSGNLTNDQRALIAGYVTFAGGESRTQRLQIRLTDAEYRHVQSDANAAGQDMSAYVRGKLGLSQGE